MLRYWLQVLLMTCTAAILALPVLYLKLAGQPNRRGFYCEDTSIRYPYLESSVPSSVLYVVSFLGPLVVVAVVEMGRSFDNLDVFGKSKLQYALNVSRVYSCYLMGSSANAMLTNLAKFTIGRLRPNFIDICRPDITEKQCSEPIYIDDYTCKGNTDLFDAEDVENAIRDGYLSFLSGHASISAQAMIFIIFYTQMRLGSRQDLCAWLLTPLLQLLCMTFAFYTSLTRVSDNKHHPWDVVAGAVLGSAVQTLNVNFVFRRMEGPDDDGNKDVISLRTRLSDNTTDTDNRAEQ